MTPSIPDLLVSHWQLALSLDVPAAAGAAVYLAATRRVRRGWPAVRTAAFLAGVTSLLVALQSGLGAYDDELLSVHMVQHVILLVVAPVLLSLGAPVGLALAALPPGPFRRRLGRALTRAGTLGEASRLGPAARPLAALGTFTVVILATHIPAFYDATLSHPALHDAEHLLYLTSGLVLWWPLIGADPSPGRRLNGFLQLVYVIAAMLPMELIGAFLSRYPHVFYPAYAAPARALGVSAVVDQQNAGAIMWVLGGFLMVLVVMWTALRALLEEERRQQSRDRHAATLGGAR